MRVEIDTHTHTLASGHAYNTMNEMAKAAADKGLKGDHIMKNRGFIKDKIKRYKELKADIKYRELKLEEIEENIIGITAMPSGEKTGATYKVTSQTEIQAIKYSEDTSEIRREMESEEKRGYEFGEMKDEKEEMCEMRVKKEE